MTKILIANRGECALRIMRTCNRLEIDCVAIYCANDTSSLHVTNAREKYEVSSYTAQNEIVQAAISTGADSIHPGYGFLSENPTFAAAVIAAGLKWVGPSPDSMILFSSKTDAREMAQKCGLQISPGSDAMADEVKAVEWADQIGYPVILKPAGGGGGIGMKKCTSAEEVATHFRPTSQLAGRLFGDNKVFLEKFVETGRHIEVQVFGDGKGTVVALGERECSIQRRFQKIIEESPAPGLNDELRKRVHAYAVALCQSVNYESAGTVEFLFDEKSEEFYFLEVNTRLQVEHGVTEMVSGFGLDIVEWMIRQSSGSNPTDLSSITWNPQGSAIQLRVYAEDPTKGFAPCPGIIGEYELPTGEPGSRFESWVFRGCEITPNYDPMIVKILQWGPTRSEAIRRLQRTVSKTVIKGPMNNLEYLSQLIVHPDFLTGRTYTTTLNTFVFQPRVMEVLDAGMNVTIQDYPGRTKRGLWRIGIPPSGPMDHLGLRLANSLVGNPDGAAALEVTVFGPSLKFHCATLVAVAGAPFTVLLNDEKAPMFQTLEVKAGDVLTVRGILGCGARCYVAVSGSFDVPDYLGSKSTFTKPKLGGHQGRELRIGDVIPLGESSGVGAVRTVPDALMPSYTNAWTIGVLPGPMANPDFLTDAAIEMLMSTDWKVHHNSNRLGIRLIGPKPEWTRADGGEGGSHPSNIHDCEYAVGTINFTGDMPIIIAHDGPSLGGFVCPITCVVAEIWKIGQVKAGDTIRFRLMSVQEAIVARVKQNLEIKSLTPAPISAVSPATHPALVCLKNQPTRAVLVHRPADDEKQGDHPGMNIRMAGDSYVLVEYGPMILDIRLRVRIHLLEKALLATDPIGLQETAPGVRSLQIRYDPTILPVTNLLELIVYLDSTVSGAAQAKLETRVFHLPMTWDHSGVTGALDRYMRSVRPEGPYLPRNIDFVAANNGVTTEEVHQKVFRASYMVLGLGDVYLGACCAVPTDPRDRLVVPKFNPARTYTQEGTVGLGGAYMCIYPMDSPGGYQLVGRTLPIWNTWGRNSPSGTFSPDKPWMLKMFDQIRFYPVPEEELEGLRASFRAGTFEPRITQEVFDVAAYSDMLVGIDEEVKSYQLQQRENSAKQNELEQESLARLALNADPLESEANDDDDYVLGEGESFLTSPLGAKVWELKVTEGDLIEDGQVLLVLEAMKMEINVPATKSGILKKIFLEVGDMVGMGQKIGVIAQ